jgi:hypothetical protein
MTEADVAAQVRPVWCIVANVVDERPYGPGGAERRRGLKLFRPGAKVYVVDGFNGMGYETLTVVGQVRKSSRFSIVHVPAKRLTNWRVRLVYSPAALRQISEILWHGHGGFWLRDATDISAESYRDALLTVADKFREWTETERARQVAAVAAAGDAIDEDASGGGREDPASRQRQEHGRHRRLLWPFGNGGR